MKTLKKYVGFIEGDPCQTSPFRYEDEEAEADVMLDEEETRIFHSIDEEGFETTYTLEKQEWEAILKCARKEQEIRLPPPSIQRDLPGGGTLSRVLPGNEREYPYRRVCSLNFQGGGSFCTGAVIGERNVLTSAHCIYRNYGPQEKRGYYKKQRIYIARNGATRPGSYHDVVEHVVNGTWKRGVRKRKYDYGMKILGDNVNFSEAPRLRCRSHYPINNTRVQIIGYPNGDKYDPNATESMWEGRAPATLSGRVLRYLIDTAGGISGAPVFVWDSGRPWIVGIHSGYDYGNKNSGCYITDNVLANIWRWKEQFPPL